MSKAAKRAKATNAINASSGMNNLDSINNEVNIGAKYLLNNTMESRLSNFESGHLSVIKNKELEDKSSNQNKSSSAKLLLKNDPSETDDEKQKYMMRTLSKMFKFTIDQSNNQMNLQMNTDYLDKNKKLIELKVKVEDYEKENKSLYKKYNEKEFEYLERIKSLERQLLYSDKSDVILIQKQNKEYEMQISNLSKSIQNLAVKQSDEKARFNSMIGELLILKGQLQTELMAMESLKKEIHNKQLIKGEDLQAHQKVELVLRYNTQNNNQADDNLKVINPNIKNNIDFMNKYGVRRTTRTEFGK